MGFGHQTRARSGWRCAINEATKFVYNDYRSGLDPISIELVSDNIRVSLCCGVIFKVFEAAAGSKTEDRWNEYRAMRHPQLPVSN